MLSPHSLLGVCEPDITPEIKCLKYTVCNTGYHPVVSCKVLPLFYITLIMSAVLPRDSNLQM